ncbi:helix-turn-helix domain-containing protein [Streptococcus uberis]|uniref:helix-turn-helix domain-containing protein n=1 Tax=Streptococcus uberis TaxID=1349 RepID=UPI00062027F6|nr:helix-turn-helix transcriptional regulator [Streptococcus uberis]KKF59242.1 hypothetical protein AF58_00675 [Streptococcus uberis C6344]
MTKWTLKTLRVNRNLTQEKFAKEFGISVGKASQWENAKTFPDVLEIKKLEDFYGVDYSDINFLP